MSDAINPPLALYIHWPFCASKCPYCDFNSHVRAQVDHARWRAALLSELRFEAARAQGHRLTSIFFGGGTPSLMQPETVSAIIAEAKELWPHADDLEITLEANPNSIEADKFAAFAQAGVNRVSIGVQSLRPQALTFLGRLHGVAEAKQAISIAQSLFPRVSFDLIYARPDQTLAQWQDELGEALAFGTEHLSLYQLTIEANTGFAGRYARGEFALPDEDLAAEFFQVTSQMTLAAGLPLYEISNHARGASAQSRHNSSYWTYGNYIGIGPGAHQRLNAHAAARFKRPETWLGAVEANSQGIETETPLLAMESAEEALLMGLRLAAGIDAEVFHRNTGIALKDVLDERKIDIAQSENLVRYDGAHLVATQAGMLVLNSLIGELVAPDKTAPIAPVEHRTNSQQSPAG
jgi:putative oxygen-independent coproporphyrinogen III oxidase